MKSLFLGITFLIISVSNAAAQVPLKRQADWGALLIPGQPDVPGMVVRRLQPNSILTRMGIREYDVVLQVNGNSLRDPIVAGKIIRSVKAGDRVHVLTLRGDTTSTHEVTLPAKPLESFSNIDVTYGSILSDRGDPLRTIFTRPGNVKGRVPVVMIVQWLSCDPVELNTHRITRYDSLMFELVTRSGFAVMRVEKPGMGDSGGPDCTACDYETELAAYRAAMKNLRQHPAVDTNNIFVFGISIGAASAPLLFAKENLRGMIVSGGFTKTWMEHMLELERRRLLLTGTSVSEINPLISKYQGFYNAYLNGRKTPRAVLNEQPHLAGIWYDADEHQYERPAAYYQQLQQQNVPAAWAQTSFPVLVIYGEYDWIMSRDDHQAIVEWINTRRPGRATYIEIPKMGHNFTLHPSLQDAFTGANGTYARQVFVEISRWLAKKRE